MSQGINGDYRPMEKEVCGRFLILRSGSLTGKASVVLVNTCIKYVRNMGMPYTINEQILMALNVESVMWRV